jgi:hypothetical protein
MAQRLQRGVMLAVVLAAVSCGSQGTTSRGPVRVLDATRGTAPSDLVLTISSCQGRPPAVVVESTSEISATVTSTTTTGSSSSCADGMVLHLTSPVGSRSFRDPTSGKTWKLDQP